MQEIHVQLPDDIYRRLLQMATALHRPLEEVLIQTIRGNLPPALDGLPPEERDLVAALAPLDDDALRAIAAGPLPAPPAQGRGGHIDDTRGGRTGDPTHRGGPIGDPPLVRAGAPQVAGVHPPHRFLTDGTPPACLGHPATACRRARRRAVCLLPQPARRRDPDGSGTYLSAEV